MSFQVAEGLQLVVRLLDRERRNHQLFAEVPVGSERIASLEASDGNSFRDLPHALAIHRKLVGRIDQKLHLSDK
jgi:hypothetical protein